MLEKHFSEVRTEDTVLDLLRIQGWSIEKPPKGNLIRQNEYKNHSVLTGIFRGKSKSGPGDAYPDFLLVDPRSNKPLLVIEAKANISDLDAAVDEAAWYAAACREADAPVVAVGVAGQERSLVGVKVVKYRDGKWKPIGHGGADIGWIPTPEDTELLLGNKALFDLSPVVPSPQILAEKANRINRILREASIKDEYRPAYVGAIMLALWQSKGNIRKDADYILSDVNTSCEKAFGAASKTEMTKILRLPEANRKLAATAWEVVSILEKLNASSAVFNHDYLGQLYETFFRYTGGNTIGQYFTPRQITRFMADLCEVGKGDKVIDPACGTGGFLISTIQRVYESCGLKYEDVIRMIRNDLYGYESEPLTAALCVANMILRGDGKTGIENEDVFHAAGFPEGKCDIAMMNPPFPHKSTDIPPQQFVEKALEALKKRGILGVILPTSMIVKKSYAAWRKRLLRNNTLQAVIALPDETFQPFASATTSVLLVQKGVPHGKAAKTSFVRVRYDGLVLKKGIRVPRPDGRNQLAQAVSAVINKEVVPGFSGVHAIEDAGEWFPGAYIPSGPTDEAGLKQEIDELMRKHASFYARYANEIVNQRNLVESGELSAENYRRMLSPKRIENAAGTAAAPHSIASRFDIFYGQKELHSRDGIPAGDSLIISPTEQYNGTFGWLAFDRLIKPPFVTVAQTGSIGEAFVQTEPCGVNDDCLVLLPKEGERLSVPELFIAAAIIRMEKWRFSYGRKLTPSRIAAYGYQPSKRLVQWTERKYRMWRDIVKNIIASYVP